VHGLYRHADKAVKVGGGNAARCATCGAELHPKRGARGQRFCSPACRQSAYRARNADSENWPLARLKNVPATPTPGALQSLRSVQNNSTTSKACNGDFGNFGDRGSGIRGPADVVECEVFSGRIWHEVVSPDGVKVTVTRWRAERKD
jgi:hypothetical protein